VKDLLEQIYKQRSDYILIGLTGKIGSGCTTAASILSSTVEQINFPNITYEGHIDDALRKRDIITKHFKRNWRQFTPIYVRDIITTFILQHDFKTIVAYLEDKPEAIVSITAIEDQYTDYHNRNTAFLGNLDNKTNPEEVYRYLGCELPAFSNKIKEGLGGENYRNFSRAFQLFGDNIRKTGCALATQPPHSMHIYAIAERINLILKSLKQYYHATNRKNYFVIDAFRNSFEAQYFKERYSAFYLFAIKAPEEDRIDRLFNTFKLSSVQIKEQDAKEDSGKSQFDSHDLFASQNISSCIQKADIHINNNGKCGNRDFNDLKYQIIKYVSLIQRPGIITPQRDEKLMQIAYTAKLSSGCISRQVGAVVTNKDGAIVAIGWNDVPKGQTQCLLRNMEHLVACVDKPSYSSYEQKENIVLGEMQNQLDKIKDPESLCGRNLSFCYKSIHNKLHDKKDQIQPRALHAEENAFLQIVKHGGQGVAGGTLYCTASPCELCSKKAYQLEISRVVYVEPYPGIAISHIIQSGSSSPVIELFDGAIGTAYHKLYEPILPYKDELNVIQTSTVAGG